MSGKATKGFALSATHSTRKYWKMIIDLFLLAGTYAGVQHFSHHNCIAIATVCALIFLKRQDVV
jgi:hypothetical protein